MRLKEQELEKRKELIVQCAFELFYEKGIHNVSVKEIAQRAGVGTVSVFRYFGSKADLLVLTVELLWEKIVKELEVTSNQAEYREKCGYEQLELFFSRFLALYEQYREYILFSVDCKAYLITEKYKMRSEEYMHFYSAPKATFCEALRKGMEDGSVSFDKDTDVEELFKAVWLLLRSMVEMNTILDTVLEDENPFGQAILPAIDLVLRQIAGRQQ